MINNHKISAESIEFVICDSDNYSHTYTTLHLYYYTATILLRLLHYYTYTTTTFSSSNNSLLLTLLLYYHTTTTNTTTIILHYYPTTHITQVRIFFKFLNALTNNLYNPLTCQIINFNCQIIFFTFFHSNALPPHLRNFCSIKFYLTIIDQFK